MRQVPPASRRTETDRYYTTKHTQIPPLLLIRLQIPVRKVPNASDYYARAQLTEFQNGFPGSTKPGADPPTLRPSIVDQSAHFKSIGRTQRCHNYRHHSL